MLSRFHASCPREPGFHASSTHLCQPQPTRCSEQGCASARSRAQLRRGEPEPGWTAIGVLVRGADGGPGAGISVSVPRVLYEKNQLPTLVGTLQATARALERDLALATQERDEARAVSKGERRRGRSCRSSTGSTNLLSTRGRRPCLSSWFSWEAKAIRSALPVRHRRCRNRLMRLPDSAARVGSARFQRQSRVGLQSVDFAFDGDPRRGPTRGPRRSQRQQRSRGASHKQLVRTR
uniref:IclR family transcriptional regulator domain-containing protein n=1 Tax=Georgenia thermotolerans TaxID=527326 RepID=UPI001B8B9422